MTVQMCWVNAIIDQATDLSREFTLNSRPPAFSTGPQLTKNRTNASEASVLIKQFRRIPGSDRSPLSQIQMDTEVKFHQGGVTALPSQSGLKPPCASLLFQPVPPPQRILNLRSIHQDGRAGQNPFRQCIDDSVGNTSTHTEIIGMEKQGCSGKRHTESVNSNREGATPFDFEPFSREVSKEENHSGKRHRLNPS